jgi:hypothetical protein
VPELYRSLLLGEPLEAAVTEARQVVDHKLPGSREWGLFTLFLQTDRSVLNWKPQQEAPLNQAVSFSAEIYSAGEKKLRIRLKLLTQNLRALQEHESRLGKELPKFLSEQIKDVRQSIRQIQEQLGEHQPDMSVTE